MSNPPPADDHKCSKGNSFNLFLANTRNNSSQLTLDEFRENRIWIKEYPIRYAGTAFNARMTVLRLANNNLLVHSPCEIDPITREEIAALGSVEFIFVPGNYHYFYATSAQAAFPEAELFICPGVEEKLPDLKYDGVLADEPDPRWENDLEQVVVKGNRLMWEVAFYVKETKTLLLVDLIENFTDHTRDASWTLKLWMRFIFRMWKNPKPAPEYQMGWIDKPAATRSIEKILSWGFDNIIVSHGDLIERDAIALARRAWASVMKD